MREAQITTAVVMIVAGTTRFITMDGIDESTGCTGSWVAAKVIKVA
jgi:hypothetical protein